MRKHILKKRANFVYVLILLIFSATFAYFVSSASAVPNLAGKSIIYNDAADPIDIYLLMKVQWWNGATWVDESIVYDGSTTPITIASKGNISLATYFNGKWNTNMAANGPGLYRVYAAALNSLGEIIMSMGNPVVSTYDFNIRDTSAPSKISNFLVKSRTENSITLTWTAPGDDGSVGTASEYDLRYSTSLITDANWDSAPTAIGEPIPSISGSSESFTVPNLNPGTPYYFAIKAIDDAGNVGPISDPAFGDTLDTIAPSKISDLMVQFPTAQTTITLKWTAPGDDGSVGTASEYDLRYSTSLITDANWDSAPTAIGEPIPSISGSSESFTVPNLNPGTPYYFAIKAIDDAGNVGPISNTVNDKTQPTVPSAPQNLLAISGDGSITLNWQAPSFNGGSAITNYTIYRSTTSGTESFLKEIGNVLTYTDSPLINGQPYYYKVSAKNSMGEGPQSNEAHTSPQPEPDDPPQVSITNPIDGDVVYEGDKVSIYASATDDKGINKVEFYINDLVAGTSTAEPYSYDWDTTGLPDGNYLIKAIAYDTNSQTNFSEITVTLKHNNPPTLSWIDQTGYESDGLDPELGDASMIYTYKIRYADLDNDQPQKIQIHISESGSEIVGSPFDMSEFDTLDKNYADGKVYVYSTSLSAGDYSYYFEAQDSGIGASPVSTITKTGPIVNSIPTPTVNSTTPAYQSTNVKLSTKIIIEFDEPMDETATLSSVLISPPISVINTEWNPSSTILTLTPSSKLDHSTGYSVTVGTGAKSQKGKNMANPYTFPFTTVYPLIISVKSPKNQLYNRAFADISVDRSAGWCKAIINEGSGTDMNSIDQLSWNLDITSQSKEGQNNISFRCSDNGGDIWNTPTSYYFTLDTVPSNINILTPNNINTSGVIINITSSEPLFTSIVTWEGVNHTMSTSLSGSGTEWYKSFGSLENKNYSYEIHASDLANNWNSVKGWVNVSATLERKNHKHNYTVNVLNKTLIGTIIEIYNETSTISSSIITNSNPSVSLTFDEGNKYNLKYTLPSGDVLDIKGIIVLANATVSPQFANSTLLPLSVDSRSNIIALDDSAISGYDSAEITLLIKDTSDTILHCKDWEYSNASCNSWEINSTSDYNAFVNGTQVKFSITQFDAYAAGYYNVPAYCGDGKVDSGETCSSCPADVGVCYTGPTNPPSGPRDPPIAPPPKGNDNTTVEYGTIAKITKYPNEIKVSPNNPYEFDLKIKNTGKEKLDNLFIEIDNAWFKFDHKQISLEPNTEKTIHVKLIVPSSAKITYYPVKIYLKGDAEDVVAFVLIVVDKEGTASIVEMDTEIIREEIENLLKRIKLFSGQGYNTSAAEALAEQAEEKFLNGDYLSASDYIIKANKLIDKSEENAGTQTFFLAYVLAGVIVSLLVLLYFFYRRYQKENVKGIIKENEEKLNPPKKRQNVQKMQEPTKDVLEQDINMDDMIKKLEEIKRKVNQ